MARYRKVDVAMWSDARFCALSQDAKFLWLWLITGPMTTPIPGVVLAGPAAMAEALEWSAERFAERFAELTSNGMANSSGARLVWLPNGPKRNKPANINAVKSWRATWELVPECDLKVVIWHALKPLAERFTEQFAELLPEPFAEQSPNTPPTQDQDQEQEQERERPVAPSRNPDPAANRHTLAKTLWLEQEQARERLRAAGIPCAPIRETIMSLDPVVRILSERTPEECRHVLAVYEAEARSKRDVRWFDGVSNWKPENVTKALAKSVPANAMTPPAELEEFDFDKVTW